MKNNQVGLTLAIVFSIIIVFVSYFMLFSAQAVTYVNNNMPVNAYTSEEKCMNAENSACEMVMSQDDQELWIVAE